MTLQCEMLTFAVLNKPVNRACRGFQVLGHYKYSKVSFVWFHKLQINRSTEGNLDIISATNVLL
jgi:hypothetical protein